MSRTNEEEALALRRIGDSRGTEMLINKIKYADSKGRGHIQKLNLAKYYGESAVPCDVVPLLAKQTDSDIGTYIVIWLKEVLKRCVADISSDNLKKLAHLNRVYQYWESTDSGRVYDSGSDQVSCSEVNEIAREELNRRGLDPGPDPYTIPHGVEFNLTEEECNTVEFENLQRWVKSGQARRWVCERKGKWNHEDWLNLLEGLKHSEFWPMKQDHVGIVIERGKYIYAREEYKM